MADGGTQLQGNFRDCGPGHPPQLDYSCQGSSCNALDPYPFGNTVANAAGILDYKSSSRCESFDSPYYGPMFFKQQGSRPGTDSRVFQDQNITLPNCKGFRIFSDGTTQGTKVNGYTRTNQPDCAPQPPPQSLSVVSQSPAPSNLVGQYIWSGIDGSSSSVTASSALGGSVTPSITSAMSSPSANSIASVAASSTSPTTAASGTPSSTESSPALYTGGTTHVRPKTGILLFIMLALSFFTQGSNAYLVPIEGNGPTPRVTPLGPDTERIAMYKLRLRATSDDIRTYAGTFGAYVAGKLGEGGQEYAKGLISGAISNICQGYFSGTPQQDLSPIVVNNCVSSVYSNDTGLSAAARFVSVFGASMFCNYVVSQAYPVAEQFSGEACHGLQDLIIPSPVPTTIQLPSTTQPVPNTEPPPTTQSLTTVQSLDHTSAVTFSPSPILFSSSIFSLSLPSSNPPSSASSPVLTSSPPLSFSSSSPIISSSSSAPLPCNGADLQTDRENCGKCGNKCSARNRCMSGICTNLLEPVFDTPTPAPDAPVL